MNTTGCRYNTKHRKSSDFNGAFCTHTQAPGRPEGNGPSVVGSVDRYRLQHVGGRSDWLPSPSRRSQDSVHSCVQSITWLLGGDFHRRKSPITPITPVQREVPSWSGTPSRLTAYEHGLTKSKCVGVTGWMHLDLEVWITHPHTLTTNIRPADSAWTHLSHRAWRCRGRSISQAVGLSRTGSGSRPHRSASRPESGRNSLNSCRQCIWKPPFLWSGSGHFSADTGVSVCITVYVRGKTGWSGWGQCGEQTPCGPPQKHGTTWPTSQCGLGKPEQQPCLKGKQKGL